MTRQLPDAPAPKYWVTGNYLFDYRDRKFHIGSMLQTMLIGSHQTDLPMIASLKFDTEALGRFTGQLGVGSGRKAVRNSSACVMFPSCFPIQLHSCTLRHGD